jgi:hypothetical protein
MKSSPEPITSYRASGHPTALFTALNTALYTELGMYVRVVPRKERKGMDQDLTGPLNSSV